MRFHFQPLRSMPQKGFLKASIRRKTEAPKPTLRHSKDAKQYQESVLQSSSIFPLLYHPQNIYTPRESLVL